MFVFITFLNRNFILHHKHKYLFTIPQQSALLVSLTPATISATPRSTLCHGFGSGVSLDAVMLLIVPNALQFDLSPSLPLLAG